jgi:hypothetical protein
VTSARTSPTNDGGKLSDNRCAPDGDDTAAATPPAPTSASRSARSTSQARPDADSGTDAGRRPGPFLRFSDRSALPLRRLAGQGGTRKPDKPQNR